MNELKQYVVVNIKGEDANNGTILVESKEIEKVVQFSRGDGFILESGLSDLELDQLNREFESYSNTIDEDVINDYFDNYKIENWATPLDDYEEVRDVWVISPDRQNRFIQENMLEYDYDYSINNWNGNNWKRNMIEDLDSYTIAFDNDDINWSSLDEFNGSDYSFGNNNCHAYCGKLGESQWLIKEWDNYQGTHTHITIIESEEQLKKWFKDHDIEDQLSGYIDV